jgi:hypothetical protein
VASSSTSAQKAAVSSSEIRDKNGKFPKQKAGACNWERLLDKVLLSKNAILIQLIKI